MTAIARSILASLAALIVIADASAYEAGWMQIQTAGETPGAPLTTVALYYPTMAAPRLVAMGPFSVDAAIGGKPVDQVKALILLSHGNAGTELGHGVLAQALARAGYLVAALRHPGDNWQDRSLIETSPERYFHERPRQVSRVIDAILADPAWKARIAVDRQGPLVGALGHSAGGYTVLALAGAMPDLSRMRNHCQVNASEDPIFCGMASAEAAAPVAPSATRSLRDERVRAVVAMAPVGVLLSAESLAAVRAAVRVYGAERDRFLVPRFHARWVADHLPAASFVAVPNAGHFAFMDTPSVSLPSPDGDIAADPPGFDRAAFLKQLAADLVAFFDRTLP